MSCRKRTRERVPANDAGARHVAGLQRIVSACTLAKSRPRIAHDFSGRRGGFLGWIPNVSLKARLGLAISKGRCDETISTNDPILVPARGVWSAADPGGQRRHAAIRGGGQRQDPFLLRHRFLFEWHFHLLE